MKHKLYILSVCLGLSVICSSLPCHACLNDRDTLAEEVQGLPDVVQIITGRFERNPPLFYQMRIQRVAKELQSHPSLLSDYDDVAVACDRLGRDEEAIRWMDKKYDQLSLRDPYNRSLHEQWYRYYANIGTFLVHRWIRAGADRNKIAEVQRARTEIARAIAIKPDAHLGREKYQLQVMDWIIAGQPFRMETTSYIQGDETHSYQEPTRQPMLAYNIDGNSRDAVKGLSGLIALGNAWESVDIFYALSQRLQYPRQAHIANLAKLHCAELIDHGQVMLMPGAPRGDALKKALKLDQSSSSHVDMDSDRKDYQFLRAEAEQWQKKRTDFMMARLVAGRHPDTDPTFWNGYHDSSPPKISIPLTRQVTLSLRRVFGYPGAEIITTIVFLSSPFILIYFILRRVAKRRQKREEMNPNE